MSSFNFHNISFMKFLLLWLLYCCLRNCCLLKDTDILLSFSKRHFCFNFYIYLYDPSQVIFNVLGEIRVEVGFFFLPSWLSNSSSIIWWKDFPFFIELPLYLGRKSSGYINTGLFLNCVPFHSSICLSLYKYHTVLIIVVL